MFFQRFIPKQETLKTSTPQFRGVFDNFTSYKFIKTLVH